MRRIIAALAALPLVFAFANPAGASRGDAVGQVQWVGCADIGDVSIKELGTQGPDNDDPGSDPILGLPGTGEEQGLERAVDGVRVDIWVYKGSCLSQDRLGSPQHAVQFDAFLHRKDVDREEGTATFSATSQSVDVRTVERITDDPNNPNDDTDYMLHLTLDFNFEDPNDRYVDETDGDGEGTQSNFYYCVQAASSIHKKAADWAPNLAGGQFDTSNALCTDGNPGAQSRYG